MAAAALVLGAVGLVAGVAQGYGQYQQGQDEQDAAYYNAKLSLRRAYAQERAVRRRGKIIQGQVAADVAASGVEMSGTPLELASLNAAEVEREAIDTRTYGQQEAEFQRSAGRNAATAGRWALATSILSGVVSAASTGYALRPNTLGTGTGSLGRVGTAAAVGPSAISRVGIR